MDYSRLGNYVYSKVPLALVPIPWTLLWRVLQMFDSVIHQVTVSVACLGK